MRRGVWLAMACGVFVAAGGVAVTCGAGDRRAPAHFWMSAKDEAYVLYADAAGTRPIEGWDVRNGTGYASYFESIGGARSPAPHLLVLKRPKRALDAVLERLGRTPAVEHWVARRWTRRDAPSALQEYVGTGARLADYVLPDSALAGHWSETDALGAECGRWFDLSADGVAGTHEVRPAGWKPGRWGRLEDVVFVDLRPSPLEPPSRILSSSPELPHSDVFVLLLGEEGTTLRDETGRVWRRHAK